MPNYSVTEISLTEWTKARQQRPRTIGMRQTDHIKQILGIVSGALPEVYQKSRPRPHLYIRAFSF